MPMGLIIHAPAAALRPFVAHYWLSLNNLNDAYLVLPDACVDIVLEVTGSDWRAWGYGSTTRPTRLACSPGTHYLGIRFLPGQSRHFLSGHAGELTDRRQDAHDLLPFPLEPVAARVAEADVFAEADRLLTARLCRSAPGVSPTDRMLREIDAAQGALRLGELAARFGKSPRQLQRQFLETVGVTAKFFAVIARATRAAQRIANDGSASLAAVAADAGYADQSHMTRDFVRLTGASPARRRVAFVQDAGAAGTEY